MPQHPAAADANEGLPNPRAYSLIGLPLQPLSADSHHTLPPVSCLLVLYIFHLPRSLEAHAAASHLRSLTLIRGHLFLLSLVVPSQYSIPSNPDNLHHYHHPYQPPTTTATTTLVLVSSPSPPLTSPSSHHVHGPSTYLQSLFVGINCFASFSNASQAEGYAPSSTSLTIHKTASTGSSADVTGQKAEQVECR